MNQTSKLLLLLTVIVAAAAFLLLSMPPDSSKSASSTAPSAQTQPCSRQAIPADGEEVTNGFSIAGTIVDNSGRVAIGAETSALLLVGEDGVTYELHFCDDDDAARYARTLAGTPASVNGTLLQKEKVETHQRKILYVDGISPVLLHKQED